MLFLVKLGGIPISSSIMVLLHYQTGILHCKCVNRISKCQQLLSFEYRHGTGTQYAITNLPHTPFDRVRACLIVDRE